LLIVNVLNLQSLKTFVLFNKEDKILFDLIYDLINSIYNEDIDVDLQLALSFVTTHQEWYHWVFSSFGFTPPTSSNSRQKIQTGV
jgi:hypothetical protein